VGGGEAGWATLHEKSSVTPFWPNPKLDAEPDIISFFMLRKPPPACASQPSGRPCWIPGGGETPAGTDWAPNAGVRDGRRPIITSAGCLIPFATRLCFTRCGHWAMCTPISAGCRCWAICNTAPLCLVLWLRVDWPVAKSPLPALRVVRVVGVERDAEIEDAKKRNTLQDHLIVCGFAQGRIAWRNCCFAIGGTVCDSQPKPVRVGDFVEQSWIRSVHGVTPAPNQLKRKRALKPPRHPDRHQPRSGQHSDRFRCPAPNPKSALIVRVFDRILLSVSGAVKWAICDVPQPPAPLNGPAHCRCIGVKRCCACPTTGGCDI